MGTTLTDTVVVDTKALTVTVPHLGLTLRSVIGAATTAAYKEPRLIGHRPIFHLQYRGVTIGEIRLKRLGEPRADT